MSSSDYPSDYSEVVSRRGRRSRYGGQPDNGFDDPANRIRQTLSRVSDTLNRSPVSRQSQGTSNWSRSSSHVARPDDPEVRDYMSNVLAGQRNVLDQYVRRASSEGARRGGMNVAGGPAVRSAIHHDAMKSLAGDYSDRFQKAMDYNKYVKDTEYGQYADSVRELQNLVELQYRYAGTGAGSQARSASASSVGTRTSRAMPTASGGSSARQSSSATVESDLDRQRKALELEQLKQQMDMQRRRDVWEREERSRKRDVQSARESDWSDLLNKAAQASNVGPYAAGLTTADELRAARLGVELGYMAPMQRSLRISLGPSRLYYPNSSQSE